MTDNNGNVSSSSASVPDDRHKRIRDEAEADYLKSVAKRQKLYDNVVKQQLYELGDLVGLQIDRVDRNKYNTKNLTLQNYFCPFIGK